MISAPEYPARGDDPFNDGVACAQHAVEGAPLPHPGARWYGTPEDAARFYQGLLAGLADQDLTASLFMTTIRLDGDLERWRQLYAVRHRARATVEAAFPRLVDEPADHPIPGEVSRAWRARQRSRLVAEGMPRAYVDSVVL